jgi:hypothetical protein
MVDHSFSMIIIIVIIKIISSFTVFVRTLAASHRRFHNLIKTFLELLWTTDQTVAKASTYTGQHNTETQTSMPRAGLEPTIPVTKQPSLRPRDHWDRLRIIILRVIKFLVNINVYYLLEFWRLGYAVTTVLVIHCNFWVNTYVAICRAKHVITIIKCSTVLMFMVVGL